MTKIDTIKSLRVRALGACRELRAAYAHDHREDEDAARLTLAQLLARLGHLRLCREALLTDNVLGYSHCCEPYSLREARQIRRSAL